MGYSRSPIGKWRLRGGFTLIEVLVASSILAFATLALVQAVSAGQSMTIDALRRARGTALADAMMEEVLSKPYADPQSAMGMGPDAGETSRALFDNIDDYHGFTEAAGAVADVDAVLYGAPHQRYARSVTVEAETLNLALLGGAQDGVQVTVTVTETIDGGAGRAWTVTRFVPEGE